MTLPILGYLLLALATLAIVSTVTYRVLLARRKRAAIERIMAEIDPYIDGKVWQ